VPRQDECQLAWYRDGACGAVGLCRLAVPSSIDLPCERDLGIIEVLESDVGPREPAQSPCAANW
jgi:hypothetical protein